MNHSVSPLYVVTPLLPDLNKLNVMMKDIWKSKYVTNHGPYHEKLQERLKEQLGVPTVLLFNNGTIALLAILKSFNFRG